MTIRLGINPIVWSNDDLQHLGAETSLETCLAEAKQAGFSGVELGHKFPRRAEALRPILRSAGLHLVSGWYSGMLLERSVAEEKQAMAAHLELLADMGCAVLIYAECSGTVHGDPKAPVAGRPALGKDDMRRLGPALTELAEHVRSRGLELVVHHHMGTVIQSAAEVDALMAGTGDAVGLLLDTGHLRFAGADPLAVAERHAGRIRHVHAKDVRTAALAAFAPKKQSFLDGVLAGVFTVPGDGEIDYGPIFTTLAKADYSGWIVVEADQDPAKAHPLTYAKKAHAYLARELPKAGMQLA